MEMKDRRALANWIRSNASLSEVEGTSRFGLVDNERFTYQAVRAFKLLWSWSSHRFAGPAGKAQDRFIDKCGNDALERRFARAKRIADRLGR